jgi:hypothetical protein
VDRRGRFALIRIPSTKSCRKFLARTREWLLAHRHWKRREQQHYSLHTSLGVGSTDSADLPGRRRIFDHPPVQGDGGPAAAQSRHQPRPGAGDGVRQYRQAAGAANEQPIGRIVASDCYIADTALTTISHYTTGRSWPAERHSSPRRHPCRPVQKPNLRTQDPRRTFRLLA